MVSRAGHHSHGSGQTIDPFRILPASSYGCRRNMRTNTIVEWGSRRQYQKLKDVLSIERSGVIKVDATSARSFPALPIEGERSRQSPNDGSPS